MTQEQDRALVENQAAHYMHLEPYGPEPLKTPQVCYVSTPDMQRLVIIARRGLEAEQRVKDLEEGLKALSFPVGELAREFDEHVRTAKNHICWIQTCIANQKAKVLLGEEG